MSICHERSNYYVVRFPYLDAWSLFLDRAFETLGVPVVYCSIWLD